MTENVEDKEDLVSGARVHSQTAIPKVRSESAALDLLAADVLEMCKVRGWSLHWTHRGAYLHLETSELIEAVRGKRGTVLGEAGDVLLVLMSITEYAGLRFSDVVDQAARKLDELFTKPHYAGEEWEQPSTSSGLTNPELDKSPVLENKSSADKTDERVCVNCNHAGFVNAHGICCKNFAVIPSTGTWKDTHCGCKCVFPEETQVDSVHAEDQESVNAAQNSLPELERSKSQLTGQPPDRVWIDAAGRVYPINPDNADFDSAPIEYVRADIDAELERRRPNLYEKKYWPLSNELRDEAEVKTTAGYLRGLRDRCMGAEQNEGYTMADLDLAEKRLAKLATYSSHTDDCEWYGAIPRTKCDCGLADLLESALTLASKPVTGEQGITTELKIGQASHTKSFATSPLQPSPEQEQETQGDAQ